MKRRQVLAFTGASVAIPLAGCLGAMGEADEDTPTPTSPGTPENPDLAVEFELIDLDFDDHDQPRPEDPPDISVEDDTEVTVEGAVQFGSSSCGTVELAYADYERSQNRLDLLVVAADQPETFDYEDTPVPCTDDLVISGYRAVVAVEHNLRRVSATEHHVFGDITSATKDLTD